MSDKPTEPTKIKPAHSEPDLIILNRGVNTTDVIMLCAASALTGAILFKSFAEATGRLRDGF